MLLVSNVNQGRGYGFNNKQKIANNCSQHQVNFGMLDGEGLISEIKSGTLISQVLRDTIDLGTVNINIETLKKLPIVKALEKQGYDLKLFFGTKGKVKAFLSSIFAKSKFKNAAVCCDLVDRQTEKVISQFGVPFNPETGFRLSEHGVEIESVPVQEILMSEKKLEKVIDDTIAHSISELANS